MTGEHPALRAALFGLALFLAVLALVVPRRGPQRVDPLASVFAAGAGIALGLAFAPW